MSRFRFRKQEVHTTSQDYAPTTVSTAPRTRSKKSSARPLVLLPGDRAMVQNPSLPVLKGQAGLRAEPDPPDSEGVHQPASPVRIDADSETLGTTLLEPSTTIGSPSKVSRSARQKKELQAKNWQEKVIPRLIEPFMELMRRTDDLRREAPLRRRALCECTSSHEINILIVRFDRIEEIQVPYCANCDLVAVDLVRSGLFPCAPFRPSLAVDIRMLDFVTRLFLRISPNHTAWCNTIGDYLSSQGYRIRGSDPLCRRFASALMWFNSLQNAVTAKVKSTLDGFRSRRGIEDAEAGLRVESEMREDEGEVLGGEGSGGPQESAKRQDEGRGIEHPAAATRNVELGRKRKRAASSHDSNAPSDQSTVTANVDSNNARPQHSAQTAQASEYLRSRCPLCFGSTTVPEVNNGCPSIIVCVDACFTHKHNDQNGKDPHRIHPDTMFISPDKVREMEEYVESRRNQQQSKRPRGNDDSEDDHLERGMKVPKSALDSCGSSFDAANGTAKSRAKGFDERALAGMFCPHGSCLFLVTMSSLGEKQHYILVMLQTLFEHVPDNWTVGFLYDVGCQVERSCWKWGFLAEFMDRIVWGVSVFHAYGHEWACQLIYHPRKCKGFGLCDGETCERCWHAISRLIAYTRVAGYHVRLYTLDCQFHFNNQQVLLNAGTWLRRKVRQCETRRRAAKEILDKVEQPTSLLREQWANQVVSQTKPLPRQNKKAAKTAVEETLRLRKNRAMADDDLEKAKEQLRKARQKLSQQEKSLGIPERRQLKNLEASPFLTKRMNALSLKIRLRQRLRARKFELDRLERSYRKQRSEQRLDNHTREAVQRREPGIVSLVAKYNKLCDEMAELIRRRKAPKFAIAPQRIERESLFDLDVDEEIWQDVGLKEDIENPPLWLCNEDVRSGIRAVLELDRCDEEMGRLHAQRKALQEWFADEWKTVKSALRVVDSQGLQHQLKLRQKYLLNLYVTWEKPLVELSDGFAMEWGPSQQELAKARYDTYTDAVVSDDMEAGDVDVGFEEDVDAVLIERLDAFELVDCFRGVETDDNGLE
ncbi:hypothetical protein K435DRAFT_858916 [Dendrothele bispora CBS 962.96]|uniref:CxC1-like cysteine cluster associated with KDZ transposases domain-containing protein n=1 Tax=Dendrothele bispora (strain CBS 962.96) TaxID=1314807 RepID=A0A4S8M2B5_DENBC|nr:hypothetical protein K435DRAFT_858916 [Dendrothele bispora CBS 962.96]